MMVANFHDRLFFAFEGAYWGVIFFFEGSELLICTAVSEPL